MSTPCKESFEYPSYECYQDIKRQFVDRVTKNEITIIDSVKEFEETYEHDKLQNLKKLSKVFDNLKAYLSNHHVFTLSDKYNGEGTCKYISYLLCDGVSNQNGECDEETFNILKEFADRYNVRKGSNMCRNNINHIEKNEFLKMKALYQFYDDYYKFFLHRNPQWYEHYCDDMLRLVYLYNTFLHKYPSDSSKFYNLLTQLHELIDTITDTRKIHCVGKPFYIRKPDLYKEPEVRALAPILDIKSIPSQGDTLDNTGISEHSEVTGLPTSAVGGEVGENPHHAKGPKVSYPLTSTGTLVSHESGERGHLHKTLELTQQNIPLGTIESYVPQRSHRPGRNYGSSEYLHTNSTLSPGDENFESTPLKESVLGKDELGYFGKIQGFFTETLGQVEPGPVLGVSGGMGALFLLFKYTPVGTFFGGRRGRNNRIPSGFPGAYPGFPEYYDGNFGNIPFHISYQAE